MAPNLTGKTPPAQGMWWSLVTAPQAFFPTRMAPQAVELWVLVGHACARTLETTVHEKVALLVLGTYGCTGLAPLSMGNVTACIV